MSEESKKTKASSKQKTDDSVTEESGKAAKSTSAKKAPAKKTSGKTAAAKAEKSKKPEKAEKAENKTAAKKDKKVESVKKQGKLVDDIRLYDVIDKPVITEKSTMAAEQNKVVFRIRPDANKADVKQAVEALFGVNVTKVNTLTVKGKRKRFRGRPGQRSDFRKAMVTLKEGQSIDLAAGLK